ncbi:response regulator transcription factor [bacterium]|nr:MAG: response regulator transcription factor [bacterium]
MNTQKLSILVADDHDIVRFGLSTVIESTGTMYVCAEAIDGPDCVHKYLKHKPDVAILDIAMPELDGIETTKSILMHDPKAVVIILTSYISEDYLEKVIKAGAFGYIIKNCHKDELIQAIRKAYNRESVFSQSISELINKRFISQIGVDRVILEEKDECLEQLEKLTGREKEILQLVGRGLTSNDIASKLHISPRTVDTHRTRIMQKLDLKNKLDVVRFVLENHLIA